MNLPAPIHQSFAAPIGRQQVQTAVVSLNHGIPPYGRRSDYVPRNPEDFGDGGAFPEIHIKQYPLDMGRENQKAGKTVALRTDATGKVRYDAILRQGMRKDQKMFSQYTDLVPKEMKRDELEKPTEKEIEEETEKTRLALEKKLMGALAVSAPRAAAHQAQEGPVFIKYTPGNQDAAHNSGAQARIIKLHDLPVDPLEPPKFRAQKGPARPPSPPVPVMHSPPRKVTMKDQQNWKVPPCVSNWKNNRGYVIPLHQRVAADGRYLQEHSINDKFAKLTEALYMAERTARERVEERARMMQGKLNRKKELQQEELREMAGKVMRSEAGMETPMGQTPADGRAIETPANRGIDTPAARGSDTPMSRHDVDRMDERDRIRAERIRERRRQRALDRRKNPAGRDREKERDVSEQIALGQTAGRTKTSSIYDTRLFDKESGMDSGFGANDDYNLYDKPLFNSTAKTIYKPTAMGDVDDFKEGGATMGDFDSSKFKADRGFEGTKQTGSRRGAQPVEFEKDDNNDDPFGIANVERQRDKKRRRRSRSRSRESRRRRRD